MLTIVVRKILKIKDVADFLVHTLQHQGLSEVAQF